MLPIGVHAEALEAPRAARRRISRPIRGRGGAAGWSILAICRGRGSSPPYARWLAVAVPAGHVGREEPALRMGLVHEVLEGFLLKAWPIWMGPLAYGGPSCRMKGFAVLVLLENLPRRYALLPTWPDASARSRAG